jgi:GR25 family glycosyltransferase involved in LPS biosynthesis
MFRGYYLNLDRNERRMQVLAAHLDDVGAAGRYQRFPAVDGRAVAGRFETTLAPGELGLWLTHERLLASIESDDRHLHVIEDDALFSRRAVGMFPRLLESADRQFPGWDVIFTEIHVPAEPQVFRLLAEKVLLHGQTGSISIVDLVNIRFASASSLFINRHSIRKYADLISGKWAIGEPFDLYLRRLVQQRLLRAYVVVPFVTTVSDESLRSDIRTIDLSYRVFNLFRQAFFIDADRPAILKEMEDLTRHAKVPTLEAIYLNAERFTFSDRWTDF